MWVTNREDVPDILYHYCSLDTFTEIIKNKTIRLSNIFKMNDYSEVIHVLELLPYVLKEEYKKSPFPFKYKGRENAEAFDEIVSDINKEINTVKYVSYIACFSDKDDDLGQWRAYGDDGKGIAIGYDGKMLSDIAQKYSQQCFFQLMAVNYSINEHKEYIKGTIVPEIFKALKISGEHGNVKNRFCSYENMVLRCALSSISAILLSATQYKNEAYKDEKEWRLCLNTLLNQILYPEDIMAYARDMPCGDLVLGKMSFTNKWGNGFSSYFDLCFEQFHGAADFIKQIIIGPCSKLNANDLDVKIFLQINGFNIGLAHKAISEIRLSKIPYIGLSK